ncbi:MAG: hypothetical protein ACEPOZ_15340 [Marinifilaceae bacterium]
MEQSNKINSPFKNIIILADFADGAWNAIQFAYNHLYTPGATIQLVQTFQKPNFGQSMVRNMTPILEKIVVDDLKALQAKVEVNYPIPSECIKMRCFQGELDQFLGYECKDLKDCCIVAGLNHSFEMRYNSKLLNRIESIHHPLFILRENFEKTQNTYIHFAADLSHKPTPDILDKIKKLDSVTNSDIQLRLTSFNKPATSWGGIRQYLRNQLSGMQFTLEYKEVLSIREWVNRSLKSTNDNLIVIAQGQNPVFRRSLDNSIGSRIWNKVRELRIW